VVRSDVALVTHGENTNAPIADDQKVQLYELMTAIRKKDLEENDPEYTPEK
jgi:hypothetical protein